MMGYTPMQSLNALTRKMYAIQRKIRGLEDELQRYREECSRLISNMVRNAGDTERFRAMLEFQIAALEEVEPEGS